jgi:RimJ/RimL family protein N-acetyltransferase
LTVPPDCARVRQPTLYTERLPSVRSLHDAFDVGASPARKSPTLQSTSHPYPHGAAAAWIEAHAPAWNEQTSATFAIVRTATGRLAGAISLMIKPEHRRAELGYWIAVHNWNRGYATEAGRRLIDFGFEVLRLHRIESRHFLRNPASGRVMQKLGMQPEGIERDWAFKWDRFESAAVYSILEPDWRAARTRDMSYSSSGSTLTVALSSR